MVSLTPDRLVVMDNSSLAGLIGQERVDAFLRVLIARDLHALVPNETIGEYLSVAGSHVPPRIQVLRQLTSNQPVRVHLLEDMECLVRSELDGVVGIPTRSDADEIASLGELRPTELESLQRWDDGAQEVTRSKDKAVEITRTARDSRHGANKALRTEGLAAAIVASESVVVRTNFLLATFGSMLARSPDDILAALPTCPILRAYLEVWTRQALADLLPDDDATGAAPYRCSLSKGRGDLFDNAIIAVASRASILVTEDDKMRRKAEHLRGCGFVGAIPISLDSFMTTG